MAAMSGHDEAEDYCRAVEAYLCRKNDGHLIRIVGPAFEQVCAWSRRGVPLAIAGRGIDRYFDRYYAKGTRRRPVRVEFCEADVLDVFDEWRRAIGIPSAAVAGGGLVGRGGTADLRVGQREGSAIEIHAGAVDGTAGAAAATGAGVGRCLPVGAAIAAIAARDADPGIAGESEAVHCCRCSIGHVQARASNVACVAARAARAVASAGTAASAAVAAEAASP